MNQLFLIMVRFVVELLIDQLVTQKSMSRRTSCSEIDLTTIELVTARTFTMFATSGPMIYRIELENTTALSEAVTATILVYHIVSMLACRQNTITIIRMANIGPQASSGEGRDYGVVLQVLQVLRS